MSSGIKKSEFTAQSTASAADTFDFVTNGTNKKITLANLITLFGTTGSLAQQGALVSTPILNTISTTHYIRNIEDGPGVKASVSPSDGVQVEHAFIKGSTGVELFVDETAANPMILNLVPGSGVSLARVGDAIQVTASGVVAAANVVVVNAMSDFPTAVTGVITLASDTAYFISAQLTTTDEFVFGDNCVIYGAAPTVAGIEYTGTGTMFTAVNRNFKIMRVKLTCANGTMFSATGTGAERFKLHDCVVPDVKTIGSVTDYGACRVSEIVFQDVSTAGFNFSGAFSVLWFDGLFVNANGGVFCDLGTATFSMAVELCHIFTKVAAGATFVSGAASSANVGSNAVGEITNSSFQGAGTFVTGISGVDARWSFQHNAGLVDSRTSALMTSAGVTVTIAASGTPVKVDGVWTSHEASRFSYVAPGRFKYTGRGDHVTLHASVTADLASGIDDCTFYFAKNGAIVSDSGILREFDSGDPGNIGLLWGLDLVTDDYIEVWCENNDTSVNIDVISAIVRIS